MIEIKLLPNDVINKIAAGEVVERPASIVKELIENSIDAFADQITLEIYDGGLGKIVVRDNGVGMSPEQLRMAFVRHATSKIFLIEDLDNIHSLGFRGEALPSISAVSNVTIRSKKKQAINGYQLEMRSGEIIDERVVAMQDGTEITVTGLFDMLPARKKFLSTSRGETMRITDVFESLALSHPHISFTYYRDDKLLIKTPGDNSQDNLVSVLLGTEFADNSLPVDYREGEFRVRGKISRPHFVQSTRKRQYFFVNQRLITDGNIQHALENAYSHLIPKGKFPYAILYLEMPPAFVDVNVHPTKKEVRFQDRRFIHSLIGRAVRQALTLTDFTVNLPTDSKRFSFSDNKNTAMQTEQLELDSRNEHLRQFLDLTSRKAPPSAAREKYDDVVAHGPETGSSRDFRPHADNDYPRQPSQIAEGKEDGYNSQESPNNRTVIVPEAFASLSYLGQIHNSFIVMQNKQGMLLIDQHAAHERINYDKLLSKGKRWTINRYAVPPVISLTNLGFNRILEQIDDLNEIGFELEEFGTNSFLVRTMPDFLSNILDAADLKEALLLLTEEKNPLHDLYLGFINDLACKASVKAKQQLTGAEAMHLVSELMHCDNWQYCPHGRPTVITITLADLYKMFKRV